MKAIALPIVSIALATGWCAQALAADQPAPMTHGTMPMQESAEMPLTDGLVKKVDKAGGKVTISHGPLPNGMPGMTMQFRVKDPAWLETLKAGQHIAFAADSMNGVMTIVQLQTAK